MQAEIRGGDSFLELTVDEGAHGDRGGLRGRALPAVLARRHRGAQPAVDGHVPQRRPPGRWRHRPARGAGRRRRHAARVGAGGLRRARTPGTTTVCTGWTTPRPSVDRGERVPGAYDPWRVPIVVDGAPAEVQGTLTYERVRQPPPVPGAGGHRRRVSSSVLRPWPRPAGARRAARGRVARRHDRRPGRLPAPPPTAAATRCCGRSRSSRSSTAIGAFVLARRSAGVVLALASVASLSGWALFRIQALFKPVLPTELPSPSTAPPSPWPSASASPPPTSPSPAASSPSRAGRRLVSAPTATSATSRLGRLAGRHRRAGPSRRGPRAPPLPAPRQPRRRGEGVGAGPAGAPHREAAPPTRAAVRAAGRSQSEPPQAATTITTIRSA